MKKYNHACDIAFEVQSDSDFPKPKEIISALEAKVREMRSWDDENIEAAVDVFDTFENEEYDKKMD